MINAEQITEILALYRKHGWILRRVLLSDEARRDLSDSLEKLFGETEIRSSDLNALWFSRASGKDREAWELRHLSKAPFALVETFGKETEENEREEIMREMEERMIKR